MLLRNKMADNCKEMVSNSENMFVRTLFKNYIQVYRCFTRGAKKRHYLKEHGFKDESLILSNQNWNI
jgi:hypothetical protein